MTAIPYKLRDKLHPCFLLIKNKKKRKKKYLASSILAISPHITHTHRAHKQNAAMALTLSKGTRSIRNYKEGRKSVWTVRIKSHLQGSQMPLQHHLKSYKNHNQLLSIIPKQWPVSYCHKFFIVSELNKTKLIDITDETALLVRPGKPRWRCQ